MGPDWPHEFPGTNWMDDAGERAVLDVLHGGQESGMAQTVVSTVAGAIQ